MPDWHRKRQVFLAAALWLTVDLPRMAAMIGGADAVILLLLAENIVSELLQEAKELWRQKLTFAAKRQRSRLHEQRRAAQRFVTLSHHRVPMDQRTAASTLHRRGPVVNKKLADDLDPVTMR